MAKYYIDVQDCIPENLPDTLIKIGMKNITNIVAIDENYYSKEITKYKIYTKVKI